MTIAATILPWTDLWLFHFEEWMWSNRWKGAGELSRRVGRLPRLIRSISLDLCNPLASRINRRRVFKLIEEVRTVAYLA